MSVVSDQWVSGHVGGTRAGTLLANPRGSLAGNRGVPALLEYREVAARGAPPRARRPRPSGPRYGARGTSRAVYPQDFNLGNLRGQTKRKESNQGQIC